MLSCAILCGGLATRLRPITETIPKSLISINGEPFIAHQLRLLRSHGVEQVTLCAGHLGEMIQEYAKDGASFGLTISYSFDGNKLLGTAGAVRKALPLLGDSFFVLYGDSFLPCNYSNVATAFQRSTKQGLMTIYRNEGHYDSSNVEAAEGIIVKYDKKNRTSRMRYIDYGLGVFHRSVFEKIPQDTFQDLAVVYQELLAIRELASYEIRDRFYEIGSLEGIQDLERYLAIQDVRSSDSL